MMKAQPSTRITFLCFFYVAVLIASTQSRPRTLKGEESAIVALVSRVLSSPEAASHFDFQILGNKEHNYCAPVIAPPCFRLADGDEHAADDGSTTAMISIQGTTASEVAAGLGWYLRHFCNMTIGWPRGGGSNVFVPDVWPIIGSQPVVKRRNSPFSYFMNVCTHSYSLVWYDWSDWEEFIDWLACSGINLILAMTGQEEVQYKVFRKLGLTDGEIRGWFNGPALLAWSRGQNEYGSGILGPLPRSWMKDQWNLQRNKILPRLRSLGIIGQLPGFQGNVPIQLKALYNDTNITEAGSTGWMDSLDPLFGRIADQWMETLINDFGTDHWYQLDGYFNGGTAPWLNARKQHALSSSLASHEHRFPLRGDNIKRDETTFQRAASAYQGLNRTDPDAIWSYQGWAILGWSSLETAQTFKGFVDSTPPGKFVVIDMEPHGQGQWRQFNSSAFFGANFIWTSLHNMGGTDGLKGDLSQLNKIPFDVPSYANVLGTGATPEGIDQNPIYYEFLFEQNFRSAPVPDLVELAVERSHRRYGLSKPNTNVAKAWTLLAETAYATDLSVQDGRAVVHLPCTESWFEDNRYTPQLELCKIYQAWGQLVQAAEEAKNSVAFVREPFIYDMINIGREILANVATPASMNFSDTFSKTSMDEAELLRTGSFYIEVLEDLDTLVGTDSAFLLGPWIESARKWGETEREKSFMEWNARTQITTWNPTAKEDTKIPDGPIDYAGKQWNGLIRDYYGTRARLTLEQALLDQAAGRPLNGTAIDLVRAKLAYEWTTSINPYPTTPTGDALQASRAMFNKYAPWFAPCSHDSGNTQPILVRTEI